MRADAPKGDATPAASLVISTRRWGGLDVTWQMLRSQTEQDFEVILVDYWWEHRRGLVAERQRETGLPPERFVHVPPRQGCWAPYHDSAQAYNTGFALARASVVCIGGDYWYAYPRYIEQHLDIHRRGLEVGSLDVPPIGTFTSFSMTGHHAKRLPLPLRRYEQPSDCLFTTFDHEFDPQSDLAAMWVTSLSTRYVITDAKTPGWPDAFREWFITRADQFNCTQNDSLPLAMLYAVNGLDEVYNGGTDGHADLDLGLRCTVNHHAFLLPADCGIAWDVDHRYLPPEIATKMYDPTGVDAKIPRNGAIFEARRQLALAGLLAPRVHNGGFSLSDPLTIQEVIDSYEAHRPVRDAR